MEGGLIGKFSAQLTRVDPCRDHARHISSLKLSHMRTRSPGSALCDRQPLVDVLMNVLYTQVGSLGQGGWSCEAQGWKTIMGVT